MNNLQKHIIITGASRGFGRDLALELAAPDTVLHLIARSDMSDLVSELEAQGASVHNWNRDLGETELIPDLMDEIAGTMIKHSDAGNQGPATDTGKSGQSSQSSQSGQPGFLALINNAGMLDPVGPVGKYDPETYRKHLGINFVSPLMLTHAFLARFQDLNVAKRVVMISSGAANKPYFGWSHYCSTKAGVDMFVKVVGIEQEQQPHPVEIMAFNPGRIGTDMQKLIRATDEKDFPMVHDFVQAWKDGKIGDSREIAGRLARQLLAEQFPSGKVLSHREI